MLLWGWGKPIFMISGRIWLGGSSAFTPLWPLVMPEVIEPSVSCARAVGGAFCSVLSQCCLCHSLCFLVSIPGYDSRVFYPADDDLSRVRVGLFSKPSWHSWRLVLKN